MIKKKQYTKLGLEWSAVDLEVIQEEGYVPQAKQIQCHLKPSFL